MADAENKIMLRVSAHFRSLAVRVIEVPEWGETDDEPLLIYGKPMNVMAAEAIFKNGNNMNMFVETMIQLACDAQGNPMFTIADKPALRRTGSKEVIERVGLALMKLREGDELFPGTGTRIKN